MIPNDSISACFRGNNEFFWETRAPEDYQDSINYELIGDTLILYPYATTTQGEIYVGNNKGKIEGTWTSTGCDYDKDKQQASCNKAYTTISWTFSNRKFKKETEYSLDKYLDDLNARDITKSPAMSDLYSILSGDNYDTHPFFQSILNITEDDIPTQTGTIEHYDVKIIESTNRSQTFTIKGITYTFKLINATKSIAKNGRAEAEVNLEVSRDSITCAYHFTQKVVNEDLCTVDTLPTDGEGRAVLTSDYGKKERTFRELDYYMLDNQDAFEACLESIDIKH